MIRIRFARDEDAAGIIHLIGSVFDEYPGCVLDVDGEMPELRRVASHFEEHDGSFWVAEDEHGIVGCIGFTPSSERGGVELKKLYVRAGARTQGLGGKLASLVEAEAARRGAAFVDLWSDTRFETAHRFYAMRGYVRSERTRELFDKSASVEYYFRRELG